ncbi:hypothetical protein AB0H76_28105 [Nocardia sp. NPDC050712]|uniref:hypothetical protein n=1 Tax=Nocardia sp. NPDC050712 TaxID=3155518 RepID=UPI0033D4F6AA
MMNAVRGIVIATVIGATTVIGGGVAAAEPTTIGEGWPTNLCDSHPLLKVWCLLTTGSA